MPTLPTAMRSEPIKLLPMFQGRHKFSYTGPKMVKFDNGDGMVRFKNRAPDHTGLKVNPKYRETKVQLDRAKLELRLCRDQNKKVRHSIRVLKDEFEVLSLKFNAAKAKFTIASENATASRSEMDELKDRYHQDQVQIARLEERLNAATGDVDRMRNPTNPESNTSIMRLMANEKKEIRQLRDSISDVRYQRSKESEKVIAKDMEVRTLEAKLAAVTVETRQCELDIEKANSKTEEEKRKTRELRNRHDRLNQEMNSRETKLRAQRARLGMTVSVKNVNLRMIEDLQRKENHLVTRAAILQQKIINGHALLDRLRSNLRSPKFGGVSSSVPRLGFRSTKVKSNQVSKSTALDLGGFGFGRRLRLDKILIINKEGEAVPLTAKGTGPQGVSRSSWLTSPPRQLLSGRKKPAPARSSGASSYKTDMAFSPDTDLSEEIKAIM